MSVQRITTDTATAERILSALVEQLLRSRVTT